MRVRQGVSCVAASLRDAWGWTPKPARSLAAHRAAATGLALLALSALAADWKIAEPGWRYEFPRDHQAHREFKTEWWYFTGNLFDATGRRFGYELTFFRHGIRPAAERDPKASRFVIDDLKFAHFAITDVDGKRFNFDQKMNRGAFGEAGFEAGERLAWIDGWTLEEKGDEAFDVAAATSFGSLRLHLRGTKPPVIHGENGVSVKAAGGTSASHYYSMPRLETTGEMIIDGAARPLRGETWFDHEWSSSQLGKGEIGWDWVCLQFEDGATLMLYRMRLESGKGEQSSSGTWIAPGGATTLLQAADFQMMPTAIWKSKATGAKYPIGWRIVLPAQHTEFTVQSVLDDQELRLGANHLGLGRRDRCERKPGRQTDQRPRISRADWVRGNAGGDDAGTLEILTLACAARNELLFPSAEAAYVHAGDAGRVWPVRPWCSCAHESRADFSGCALNAGVSVSWRCLLKRRYLKEARRLVNSCSRSFRRSNSFPRRRSRFKRKSGGKAHPHCYCRTFVE